MISVSKTALRAALMLGCAATLGTTPAAAKDAKDTVAVSSPGGRTYNLTKEDRAALAPLNAALQANDLATAATALTAAKAATLSADARYLLASEQLKLAVATNTRAMQSEAIDAMISSGLTDAAVLPELLRNQAALASDLGDRKKAEASLARLIEISPNDVAALMTLAKVRSEQKNYPGAVQAIDRAIQVQQAANQPVRESWYKYGLNYAMVSSMAPQALQFAEALVKNYPTTANWRDAILAYRDLAKPDKLALLDALRLQRFTKSLAGERDYVGLADSLNRAGYPGEATAVLDEGVANNMVSTSTPGVADLRRAAAGKVAEDKRSLPGLEKSALAAATGTSALSTGDVYFGYGNYAKAVELYRAALQKGSVDTDLVNTHLGMALAMTGNKPEAETAFKAITGQRQQLADFLLLWLSQRV
jgi:tetratricopeptide (TPR) repeat protein